MKSSKLNGRGLASVSAALLAVVAYHGLIQKTVEAIEKLLSAPLSKHRRLREPLESQ